MANEEKALHDEYPVVVSKMDPLIIRVSKTVLLVGSTSYTAKIKISQLFSGFYIYVSSLGTPIYTEKVNIGEYSIEGDNNRSEGSDAWNYVEEKACDWINALEESMETSDTSKNIVDLLRECKYQEHFDLSGHIIDPDYKEKYGENFELCTENSEEHPLYLHELNNKVELLNDKITYLTKQFEYMTGAVNDGPSNKELSTFYKTIGKPIADAVESGLNTLVGKMASMEAEITAVKSTVNTINTNVNTINTNVNTVNGTVNTINSNVGTVITNLATVQGINEAINQEVVTMSGVLDNCWAYIAKLGNGEDGKAIAKINTMYNAYSHGGVGPVSDWFVYSKAYPDA